LHIATAGEERSCNVQGLNSLKLKTDQVVHTVKVRGVYSSFWALLKILLHPNVL